MFILLIILIIFLRRNRVLSRNTIVTAEKEIEKKENKKTRRSAIDYIVKIAIFSTIASLLYTVPFLQFKLPFFPAFLEFQFSNLPAILTGFILGPVGGSLVVVIKTLVKLPMSHTGFVGELADLVIGVSIVVSSSLIYKKNRTVKGGLIALAIGTVVWIGASLFANWAVLIRWYAYLFGMDTIINMCKAVIPFIDKSNFMLVYLTCCCLPFNAIIAVATSVITFVTYKRISKIFKKDFFKK